MQGAAIARMLDDSDTDISEGGAPVDASGNWRLPASGLAPGLHIFIAEGQYGGKPVSPPRALTVEVMPAIGYIWDTKGEVPDGGTTADATLSLSGTAQAGEEVEIFDGETWKGKIRVTSGGAWLHTLEDLANGPHRFTARGLYGTNPVSPERSLTVAGLSIPQTEMELKGIATKIPDWPTNGEDFPGNTAVRVASGGTPPYRYASDNPAIAAVDAEGKVTGEANGTTLIRATDTDGRQVAYRVIVTNVFRLVVNENLLTGPEAEVWRLSIGGNSLSPGGYLSIYYVDGRLPVDYVDGRLPVDENHWFCTIYGYGGGTYLYYNMGGWNSCNLGGRFKAWCGLPKMPGS
ncbi:Ig-like domain-containing protein [Mesorhizobium retamae]|uniref:Ig-like domain-containing protein n=1 Tax=Mesorhizobium retamae TaxID=2912854 RepID=UPI001EF67CB7